MIEALLDLLVWLVVAPPALALAIFCAELGAGLCKLSGHRLGSKVPKTVVLMPAHNEACVIASTLRATLPALTPTERLLVIADNCTDETAAIARSLGAEVTERHDAEHRGKGYALAWGIDALRGDPPDCVVVIDADCRPQGDAVSRLARIAVDRNRPVQACYLFEPCRSAGVMTRISSFAFLLKNLVRQRGAARLGGTCLLTGSGMAIPWSMASKVDLANGEIVEDLVLGVKLVLMGSPPLFDEASLILSDVAPSDADTLKQRSRWERGFLATAVRYVPRLVASLPSSAAKRAAAWTALHLLVPPAVMLLGLSAVIVMLAGFLTVLTGSAGPATVTLAGLLGGAFLLIAFAWQREARAYFAWHDLPGLFLYVARKLKSLRKFWRPDDQGWTKTDRSSRN